MPVVFDLGVVDLPEPPLSRRVFRLTEAERGATSLTRFARRMVPVRALAGLRRLGWQLACPVDGLHDHLYRPVGADLRMLLQLDDGLSATIRGRRASGWWRPSSCPPLPRRRGGVVAATPLSAFSTR